MSIALKVRVFMLPASPPSSHAIQSCSQRKRGPTWVQRLADQCRIVRQIAGLARRARQTVCATARAGRELDRRLHRYVRRPYGSAWPV